MRSKKAIKNIISSLIQQIINIICGFILPKAIISAFGSNVNGLVTSITQFLAYITLLESGMGPVVKSLLYKPIAEKNKDEIQKILTAAQHFFNVIAYIFIIYLIVLCFIYPIIINSEFDIAYTVSLIIILSISTFSEYYISMIYKLFLQADQKTYVTSNIQTITILLNTVISVILIKFGANIQLVKLVTTFIFISRPIVQNIYVRKKYNIDLKKIDEKYKIKQKWDGLAQHIASVIYNSTDTTILTIFTQITEVSVYSVYSIVVRGIKSIIQAFTGGVDASFGDMIVKGEEKQLNKSFSTYELFYFSIITVAYTCTMILIIPFIKIYTMGITDANYIRPLFAYLLVLSEFAWAIRLPYSSITLAAGHFKQTRKGAWVESITNIVISIVLVNKFGMVGVAIGTLISMIIRTLEFIYHTSKYILKRSIWISIKKILLIIIETIIIIIIISIIPKMEEINPYLSLIIQAIETFIISIVIVSIINFIIVYRKESKDLLNMVKRNFLKNSKIK